MRSCLVLGSGRSGTSMLAGTLYGAGYYVGEHLIPPADMNPKGFFEDEVINWINEDLLAQVTPDPLLGYSWRWLARVPVGTPIPTPSYIPDLIREQTVHSPFCFKDPRFCYTLPAWRPFVGDALFLCIFREPTRTVNSMLKDCQNDPYLKLVQVDHSLAFDVWRLMYRHILEVHRKEGEWLFVHYDQLLDGSAIPQLESALGVKLDEQFPDPKLRRSSADGPIDPEALGIYEELCELAGYRLTISAPSISE